MNKRVGGIEVAESDRMKPVHQERQLLKPLRDMGFHLTADAIAREFRRLNAQIDELTKAAARSLS